MKPLGKQPGHLTACPDLCQALSQGGKLTQCVIMEPRPCQALLGLDLAAFPGLEERTHHRARTSSPMLGAQKMSSFRESFPWAYRGSPNNLLQAFKCIWGSQDPGGI